ncbi:nacht nucleoside triphosphatase [Metarhizium guizhouense ARSEF 977]|uniref:Nacht nucleoside triphosphatase n=1 Tax=Metarhizium guizhouense (strain ARSEF 977) TaxID=1276136 RepID=A0A0B4GKR6_METGA|nr:nacht nucleoside triphosphatase [Metarhizium guizhouense ARSEF 977]
MARRISLNLGQIYPSPDADIKTDIDIIAIHGLDTRSPDTWTWTDRKDLRRQVNWLKDGEMLPNTVKQARIFTCDWPAELLQDSVSTPTTLEQSARCLLDSIRQLLAENDAAGLVRPILFIASCLGGIILIKALEIDDSYDRNERHPVPLRTATRGIVFLATPFRGTAFKHASWPILQGWALIQDQTVSALIEYTKEATSQTETLVENFLQLAQEKNYHVFTFHEGRKTALLRKIRLDWMVSDRMFLAWPLAVFSAWLQDLFSPWLVVLFVLWLSGLRSYGPKLLVDENSASLPGRGGGRRLERTHVQMNKFNDANCEDYKSVAEKIRCIVDKIHGGSELQKADARIRDTYTDGRLKIERLSGESLPMEQCYINLAIVAKSSKNADCTGRGSQGVSASQSSPFSLFTRQKVKTPDKAIQAELPTLFNERNDPQGNSTHPRRILIQGRAGVGKTTLCKKIVSDFTRNRQTELHCLWTKLFDRVLWVPLRNLKGRPERYNFSNLFYDEYFCQCTGGQKLAEELWREIDNTGSRRTLYLLDGLDEVSRLIGSHQGMSRFLTVLLSQPNVIITSRPSVSLSVLQDLDLDLETIGFYPDQVKAYLEADPNIKPRASEVQSFLQEHWLIQGLVRIPIQLDALCYTWDDVGSTVVPDTMTGIYQAIVQRLWKKDVIRLEKRHDGELVNSSQLLLSDVEDLVSDEACFLQSFAFTGLWNDVIDYTRQTREAISKKFKPQGLFLNKTLPCLSFVRMSDPESRAENQTYHFLHLTFQEYFAARYFTRQWLEKKSLECLNLGSGKIEKTEPVRFLQKHKYTARYDIFWRFVNGLLDECGQSQDFFNTIEDEPLDLLGPAHQRLVMNSLSEVSAMMPLRRGLEEKLKLWLLFECTFSHELRLSSEMEFPEQALCDAFQEGPDDAKVAILGSMRARPAIPLNFDRQLVYWLRGDIYQPTKRNVLRALGKYPTSFPNSVFEAVIQWLGDTDYEVQRATMDAIKYHSSLSDKIVMAVVQWLGNADTKMRSAASFVLRQQSSLSGEILAAVAQQLDDTDSEVRQSALKVLRKRSNLSDKILSTVVQLLDDENYSNRWTAIETLQEQSNLSNEILVAIAQQLNNTDSGIRWAAPLVLQEKSRLSDKKILAAVVQRLDDDDWNMQEAALEILERQSNLSNEVLTAVTRRLDDEDEWMRRAAVKVLEKQSHLSDEILTAVLQQLDCEDRNMQWNVRKVLKKQSDLSDEILAALVQRLDSGDDDMREGVLGVLEGQSNLSNKILSPIIQQLDNPRIEVQSAAALALRGQLNLSNEILASVAQRLDNFQSSVQECILQIFRKQLKLPKKVVTAVAKQLDNPGIWVQTFALQTLEKQSNLPDEILTAVARLLGSESVGPLAEVILRKYDDFYFTLLASPSAGSLFKTLLRRAFGEQYSWYIEYGRSCVNMPDGVRSTSIDNMQEFVALIDEARPPGIPRITGVLGREAGGGEC